MRSLRVFPVVLGLLLIGCGGDSEPVVPDRGFLSARLGNDPTVVTRVVTVTRDPDGRTSIRGDYANGVYVALRVPSDYSGPFTIGPLSVPGFGFGEVSNEFGRFDSGFENRPHGEGQVTVTHDRISGSASFRAYEPGGTYYDVFVEFNVLRPSTP